MTHLYRLDCSAADAAHRLGAQAGHDPWAGGYVAPMNFAPVVTAGRDFIAGPRPPGARRSPRITPRLWGVMPPPAADDPARRITSVRNPDSPFWIGNLRNSEFRCLIPATSFMLWGSGIDVEGRKLKHWFAPEDAALFTFAAVWKDEDVPAFAILTQAARGAAKAAGCKSMPIIVPDNAEAQQTWLYGAWQQARSVIDRPSDAPLTEWSGQVP